MVPVREVQLNLFEKALTGYRVSIPVESSLLREGIQQYLAAYPVQPLVLEEGILFDNFSYPPITTARPITLYYRLQSVESVFTELTLVGLYGYQQSITVHQQPDLALRMLLDLSEMVQGLTGNPIDFDALFERQSVSEIQNRYESRKEQNYMDFFVQRQGEFIGSDQGTLVKTNPFGENKPENFATDDQVVAAITARFRNYVEQNRSDVSPFVNDSASSQILWYRDSLQRLQTQYEALLGRSPDTLIIRDTFQQTQLETLFSDTLLQVDSFPKIDTLFIYDTLRFSTTDTLLLRDTLVMRDTLVQIDTVPHVDTLRLPQLRVDTVQVAAQASQLDSLRGIIQHQDRSLKALRQQSDSLRRLSSRDAKDESQLQIMQVRLNQLQETNQRLLAQQSETNTQTAEYVQLQQVHEQLKGRYSFQARMLENAVIQADSLRLLSGFLQDENEYLQQSRDSLAQEILVLDPESPAAKVRREVYLRQLSQLVEAQQNQSRREVDLTRREKQIYQRERYLAEYELTGKDQSLLGRIIQLENQLNTLERENQNLKEQSGSGKEFAPTPTRLPDQPEIQGFRFDPQVASNFAREQILAWFQVRGMDPSLRRPLRFVDVLLPGFSNEPLTLSFYELSSEKWILTFRKESGEAIQPQEVPIGELNKLLNEIFR